MDISLFKQIYKMRNLLRILLITPALLVWMSCNTQVDCPDFDEELLEWFPYEDDDILSFSNSQNDSTFSLKVWDVYIEHQTSYSTGNDCGKCWSDININTSYLGNSNIYVDVSLDNSIISSETYTIKGTSFGDSNTIYSELDEYVFDGVSYSDVKVFIKSNNEDSFIKLIVAKGYGIVGLVDSNDISWSLDASEEKNSESIAVEIEYTSC